MLESLLIKVAGLKTCNFIKKRLQHRCFPVRSETRLKVRRSIENNLHRCAEAMRFFCKKRALKNFIIFTGKYLRRSLYCDKVACLKPTIY